MIVIPVLYLKFGRAKAPELSRDYPAGNDLVTAGD
jgi:hypothetical protein